MARFASQFDVPDDLENLPNNLPNEDRWILSVFDAMMDDVQNFWKEIEAAFEEGLKGRIKSKCQLWPIGDLGVPYLSRATCSYQKINI